MTLALEIRDLSKAFGGLKVTQHVNLAVARGERRLIIGPNGAGKTTLFNQITGEIAPDAGSVHLMGRDITKAASRRRTHLGMSRTYQIITLFAHDTILRNVSLALLGLSPLRWNPFSDMDHQHHLIAGAVATATAGASGQEASASGAFCRGRAASRGLKWIIGIIGRWGC